MSPRIIRKPEVLKKTGLANSSMYKKIAESAFPAPIKLGGKSARSAGWIESEIDQWIEDRINESRPEEIS